MSITTALEARRDALRDREAGFTLIELLVVVIIIGILAAIAIPIYIGVQNNAKDSAVKSDLVNAKTAIVAAGTDNNGNLPTAVTDGVGTGASPTVGGSATINGATVALAPYGWSVSTNSVAIKYVATAPTAGNTTPTAWCVFGQSTTGKRFQITSSSQVTSLADTATTCTAA